MRVTRGNEQKRTRLDGVALLAIKEQALSTGNEVNLVSPMGLLRVVADRGV